MCNRPLLDELTLPGVSRCGLNVPCPDRVTPMRVASSMWSWAEGHPTSLPGANGTSLQPAHPWLPAPSMRSAAGSDHAAGPATQWLAGSLQRLWQRLWLPEATRMLSMQDAVSCSHIHPACNCTTGGRDSLVACPLLILPRLLTYKSAWPLPCANDNIAAEPEVDAYKGMVHVA